MNRQSGVHVARLPRAYNSLRGSRFILYCKFILENQRRKIRAGVPQLPFAQPPDWKSGEE
jgi:hypothetical protein